MKRSVFTPEAAGTGVWIPPTVSPALWLYACTENNNASHLNQCDPSSLSKPGLSLGTESETCRRQYLCRLSFPSSIQEEKKTSKTELEMNRRDKRFDINFPTLDHLCFFVAPTKWARLTAGSLSDSGRPPVDLSWLSVDGCLPPALSASGPPADRAEQRSWPSPWAHRGHRIVLLIYLAQIKKGVWKWGTKCKKKVYMNFTKSRHSCI